MKSSTNKNFGNLDESIAPALLAAKLRYEKSKRVDFLNRKLSNRPTRERLVELHFLEGNYNFDLIYI